MQVRRISQLVLKREHKYVDTVGMGCVETPVQVSCSNYCQTLIVTKESTYPISRSLGYTICLFLFLKFLYISFKMIVS